MAILPYPYMFLCPILWGGGLVLKMKSSNKRETYISRSTLHLLYNALPPIANYFAPSYNSTK